VGHCRGTAQQRARSSAPTLTKDALLLKDISVTLGTLLPDAKLKTCPLCISILSPGNFNGVRRADHVESHLKRSADCSSTPHRARSSLEDSPSATHVLEYDLQRITSSPIHHCGCLKIWDARRIQQEFPAHVPCCNTVRLNPTTAQSRILFAGYKKAED
jgi:hypothetical protein